VKLTPARRSCSRGRGARSSVVEEDDIDHFGNRRLRTVGELIQNQVRTGWPGWSASSASDATQDVEAITPQTLINPAGCRLIKSSSAPASCRSSMDQTNPLSGLTHKRRLSALGPAVFARAGGLRVRDVHPSH